VRVLYLTYDGLSSLIGQSQVWPYLKGLAKAGHRFDVISFEQTDRTERIGTRVAADIEAAGITWHPCRFRARPPLLAKYLDQREMAAAAGRLATSGSFDIVHARSYVAADAALEMKAQHGMKFLFDMRGFWVDERRESGRWPASNPLYGAIYRKWKEKERAFLEGADHIVVLTEAARDVVRRSDAYRGQPVTVIPCCIDHSAFAPRTVAAREAARARLGIGNSALVLAYLGSVGTIYLLGAMLRFFERLRGIRPNAKLLLIGWHDRYDILAAGRAEGLDIPAGSIVIQPAEHGEVPAWLAAADFAVAFRQPSFSSLGASPTKLAEYLACGLPVVVNDGVGDVGAIVRQLGAGAVLPDLSASEMDAMLDRLGEILAIEPRALSERSRRLHDMPVAIERYREVYESLAAAVPENVP